MTNRKSTKRALLGSVVAMVLCLAMLVGATFAWFTDTASTGVNKIQAGNLDVQLVDENGNSLEGKTLEFKKAANAAEGEAVLWEPGCTYELPAVYVKNNGKLALKYKVTITGINGSAKLNDVIDWTINDADLSADHSLAAGATSEALTIKGHMKESAGNEYMNESIDGIAITVAATQDTVENDSLGNTYDKDAKYPIVAMDTLQELINNATEPVSAKLEGNIAGSLTVPQGKEVTLDLNGFTLTGGDSHAILNHGTLCIKDSSGNGKIVASKANTSALRNAAVCVIDGGTFTRAAGVDNKWHTVENFGTMTFNGGKVIAEDGQSFAIVNGWNYMIPANKKLP